MKNSIIILSLLFAVVCSSAQEVEFNKKTKEVKIDGEISFKIIKTACGFEPDCYFDVYDINGIKVLKIVYKSFKSPVEINKSNPEGVVRYFQYIFLETGRIAESATVWMKEKKLAAYIVKHGLFKAGELDEKAVKEFILMNGTPFSDRIKF